MPILPLNLTGPTILAMRDRGFGANLRTLDGATKGGGGALWKNLFLMEGTGYPGEKPVQIRSYFGVTPL